MINGRLAGWSNKGGAAVIAAAFFVLWGSAVPAATEAQSKKVSASSGKPATHPVTQAAVQAGVFASAGRINQIAGFLTGDRPNAAFLFLPEGGAPDRQLFSSSFEVVGPSGASAYASASFAPYPGRESAAVYDMVEYAPAACGDLQKTTFAAMKETGVIKQNIRLLDGGSVKIFLMPAGDGCVTIKKEVIQQ